MNDPRRKEYRTECAAAARRGVVLLRWPKEYSLFVSNLNDNVNEQLLREELSSCGPVSLVKIPTLNGRSLGLARVELQPGVKSDRFIKEFHGRELLGQKMNVVVDQGAKKFEEAVHNAKSPKKAEATEAAPQAGAPQTSPKKRARATDSPTYSPASPARPISDADGPSPSKPKRPRCSPMPSSHRHETTRATGDNYHDTNRSHGEQPFFQDRKDSYRGHEPYPPTYSRNFAKDGPRDYRARYQEGRKRYDYRSSFHQGNRFNSGGSRQDRHESFNDNSSHPHMHRDWHDEFPRHDRRHSGSYKDWNRAPPRRYESNYGRDYTDRHGSHNASTPSNIRQALPRDNKQVGALQWMDDIRPAVSLKGVPKGTKPEALLHSFRHFRPANAANNGYGNWTMWFDAALDRNRATAVGWLKFRNTDLEIKSSSYVVGRKSIPEANRDGIRTHEGYSRDFDKRNDTCAERRTDDGFGPSKFQHREERYSRRGENYEDHRNVSHLERRSSGQSSTYRGAGNRFRDRVDTHHNAPDSAREHVPGRQSSAGERAGRYNTKEGLPDKERKPAHGDGFPLRRGRAEHTRRHEASVNERACASNASHDVAAPGVGAKAVATREGARITNSDIRENEKNGEVAKSLSSAGKHPGNVGQDEAAMKNSSKKIDAPSQHSVKTEQKAIPPETPKKLTVEDFADMVAQHVYRTAKEAIASRGAAVQKSLVVQSVMKFVKSRRERESHEKAKAKQAALAKQKASKSAAETAGGASSSGLKTAHLDLVETFLKPTKPKQKKPPLPDRQTDTPSKKRLRKSRFADNRVTESEQDIKPGSSVYEDEEFNSPAHRRGNPAIKRRRLVLPSSPGSPDPGHASPDGNRQNSVESVASSELFRDKDLDLRGRGDENRKIEESVAPHDTIMNIERPRVRHAKASSLKLSSPSTGEGSIPHLVLSARPPLSPAVSGPVGSTFTTSEDSTSQGPSKPPGIAKKSASRKAKTSAKTKKKRSRGQVRLSKKNNESTTDEEQYADVLLSLNDKLKNSRSDHGPPSVEVFADNGFIDVNENEWADSEKVEAEKVKDSQKRAEVKEDDFAQAKSPERVDPEECEPPERVGKCARTDTYVRAENVGQHRQRNVHCRTSTSKQTSRECRQENRVYRKGVSRINPKNDIISLNHLKQRRKKVSFGQSRIHGMGLYAKENIETGEFVIEYVGDLIRRVVADLREKKYVRQGMGDSYLFRLSGDWVVDATRRGGIARYINHSCDPNVIAKIISVVGEPKIVFYSKRSIKEGEELTYDYKFDYEAEDQKIPCLCKAPSCRKYLN